MMIYLSIYLIYLQIDGLVHLLPLREFMQGVCISRYPLAYRPPNGGRGALLPRIPLTITDVASMGSLPSTAYFAAGGVFDSRSTSGSFEIKGSQVWALWVYFGPVFTTCGPP